MHANQNAFSGYNLNCCLSLPLGWSDWRRVPSHPPIHAWSLWREEGKKEEEKEGEAKVNRREQMSSVTAQQALPPSSPVWMPVLCWWLNRGLNIPWNQSQSHLSGCYTRRLEPFICKKITELGLVLPQWSMCYNGHQIWDQEMSNGPVLVFLLFS